MSEARIELNEPHVGDAAVRGLRDGLLRPADTVESQDPAPVGRAVRFVGAAIPSGVTSGHS
jgi:hypothetical protein